MKKTIFTVLAMFLSISVFAQEKVYLWPSKVGPGSEKVKAEETVTERSKLATAQNRAISGVTQPYFEVYKPEANVKNTLRSILIIPGGAYQRVVYDTEGLDYVKAFTKEGYTCFVLVYRTPNDGHKNAPTVALQDAQRAMRIIKSRAEEFGISPFRVGVMGSSAGGHVAASLATRFNEEVYKAVDGADKNEKGEWNSAKPAFQFLLYPVITMQDAGTHSGSQKALLGEKAKQKDKDDASCELHVTGATPPAFIVCACDDSSVKPVENAIAYYKALREKKVATELHIFPESGHGFGVIGAYGTCAQWPSLAINWIKTYMN